MGVARHVIDADNDDVRVTTWTFGAAGAATGRHRHEFDYVVVPITGGRFEVIEIDGSVREMDQVAGFAVSRQGGHRARRRQRRRPGGCLRRDRVEALTRGASRAESLVILVVRIPLIVSLAACAALVLGCQESGFDEAKETARPLKVQHVLGESKVPGRAERPVVMSVDSLDDTLALGVQPLAAAVPGEKPPAYLASAAAGVEMLAQGAPVPDDADLIIASAPQTEDEFLELVKSAPTVVIDEGGAQWKLNVRLVGEALGRTNDAEELLSDYDRRVATVRETLPSDAKVAVKRAGRDSFAASLLADAGVSLVAPKRPTSPSTTRSGRVPAACSRRARRSPTCRASCRNSPLGATARPQMADRRQRVSSPVLDALARTAARRFQSFAEAATSVLDLVHAAAPGERVALAQIDWEEATCRIIDARGEDDTLRGTIAPLSGRFPSANGIDPSELIDPEALASLGFAPCTAVPLDTSDGNVVGVLLATGAGPHISLLPVAARCSATSGRASRRAPNCAG